jgi:hypothetical protein
LSDLLFSHTQADFLDKAVKQAFGNDFPAGLDVSREFKKYLALVRILEKAAALSSGCLIKGEVDETLLNILGSNEFLDAESDLSDGALGLYLQVQPILLNYPDGIYQTLTGAEGGPDLKDLLHE